MPRSFTLDASRPPSGSTTPRGIAYPADAPGARPRQIDLLTTTEGDPQR